nr:MAG TPA: hypothetical protein [Bacteriophage sp.]
MFWFGWFDSSRKRCIYIYVLFFVHLEKLTK